MFLSPPRAEQLIRQHGSLSLHPINPWLTVAPSTAICQQRNNTETQPLPDGGLPLAQTPPLRKPGRPCPPERVTRSGEQHGGRTLAREQDPRYFLLQAHPHSHAPSSPGEIGLSWRVLEKPHGGSGWRVVESRSLGEEADGGHLEAGRESPSLSPPASYFFQEPVAERSPQGQPGTS